MTEDFNAPPERSENVPGGDDAQLLPQLVAHFREHRTKLRQEWGHRIQ